VDLTFTQLDIVMRNLAKESTPASKAALGVQLKRLQTTANACTAASEDIQEEFEFWKDFTMGLARAVAAQQSRLWQSNQRSPRWWRLANTRREGTEHEIRVKEQDIKVKEAKRTEAERIKALKKRRKEIDSIGQNA
jgi:hypothetical protein